MNKKYFKLICPECKKEFDDCKSWPAYHNREDFQCPHCGYMADSWDFRVPLINN